MFENTGMTLGLYKRFGWRRLEWIVGLTVQKTQRLSFQVRDYILP